MKGSDATPAKLAVIPGAVAKLYTLRLVNEVCAHVCFDFSYTHTHVDGQTDVKCERMYISIFPTRIDRYNVDVWEAYFDISYTYR